MSVRRTSLSAGLLVALAAGAVPAGAADSAPQGSQAVRPVLTVDPTLMPVAADHDVLTAADARTALARWTAGIRRSLGSAALPDHTVAAPAPTGFALPLGGPGKGAGAGDLDGDGRTEVLDLRTGPRSRDESSPISVIVRRGRDGAGLWRREVPGLFGLVPLRETGGRPGVLLVSGAFTEGGEEGSATLDVTLTLTRVSSRGVTLSTATMSGSLAETPTGIVARSLPGIADVETAAGAGHDDVLLTVVDGTATELGSSTTTRVRRLSGADGSLTDVGAPVVAASTAAVTALGDLDRDGRSEHGVVTSGPAAATEVRTAEGSSLWRRPEAARLFGVLLPFGEMTGDATPDLMLVSAREGAGDLEPRTELLSGVDGATRLTVRAFGARPLGDVDGDRRVDLGTADFDDSSGDLPDVLIRGLSATGRVLYTRRIAVPEPDPDSDFGFVGIGVLSPGDVQGDGAPEFLVHTEVGDRNGSRSSDHVVDGRSGRTLATKLPAPPVYASLDGRGDDLAETRSPGAGRVRVSAFDGLTRRPLWRADVRAGDATRAPLTLAAAVDGDSRGDVLTTAVGSRTSTLLVLSGRDGRVLWRLAYPTGSRSAGRPSR